MADQSADLPSDRRPVLAVTCGEPAGIGPEISIAAAWHLRDSVRSVLIGDAAWLAMLAQAIDPQIRLAALSVQALHNDGLPAFPPDRITVIDCPFSAMVVAGHLDARNGMAVLRTLDIAIDGARTGMFHAVVTAPLQKSTINDAGVPFTGHTEYLAERTETPHVVMMLSGVDASVVSAASAEDAGAVDGMPADAKPLRVALATTHLPLKEVPAAITVESLRRTLRIIDTDLRGKFGIARPRILVTGLNPHAGEGGYLGREEIDTITPALNAARAEGIDCAGPYPADTLFQPKYLRDADCVLAMYHDQGLPVLKHATFGRGVNITLGLPIIRTSVDHGTALDVAAQGTGHADCGSMIEALRVAARMVRASRSNAA